MKFNLARQVRRPSRRPIPLPPIITTKAQADELAAIYLRIVAGWREAWPSILAAYDAELQRTLQTDSPETLGADIDSIAAALHRLVLELTPSLRDWAFRIERWHRGKWIRGILSAATVDLTTQLGALDAQDTIETVIQRNVSLVRDVSDETRRRVADSVFRGLQQRTPAREVAKEIREATSMARGRSIRIAADQAVKLSSALDAERQRQAGLDKFKWRHSGKAHPRPWHRARDGKLYDQVTGKAVDGDEIIPANDMPGVPPFCGCVRQGVIVFDDD